MDRPGGSACFVELRGLRGAVPEQVQAPRSAHPQTVSIFVEGVNDLACEAARNNNRAHHADQAILRADPKPPVARLVDGAHRGSVGLHRNDGAVQETCQPAATGADPKPAVVRRVQRGDVLSHPARRRAFGLGEAHAVETRQSLLRPDPEVAVPRLRQGLDRVLRQTRLAGPPPADQPTCGLVGTAAPDQHHQREPQPSRASCPAPWLSCDHKAL